MTRIEKLENHYWPKPPAWGSLLDVTTGTLRCPDCGQPNQRLHEVIKSGEHAALEIQFLGKCGHLWALTIAENGSLGLLYGYGPVPLECHDEDEAEAELLWQKLVETTNRLCLTPRKIASEVARIRPDLIAMFASRQGCSHDEVLDTLAASAALQVDRDTMAENRERTEARFALIADADVPF